LLLNARGAPRRTVCLSRDGGQTWGLPRPDPALSDSALWGGCQASLIRYSRRTDGFQRDRLLFANPADADYRFQLTIRLSYDEGQTWPVAKVLEPGPAAYSSMAVLPDGTIGIIYETGKSQNGVVEYYTRLTLARFNLQWLSNEQDFSEPRGPARPDRS
jgi:sialidase-1